MRRYLWLALAAQLGAGRALFLLAVTGVALGVGSVLSIQILNGSALGAFAGSVRAISGDAQLSIVGRGPALADDLLVEVLAVPGVRQAVPIYRVEVALDGGAGPLEVVGTDLFAPARGSWGLARGELGDVLSVPGWVAVTPALAHEMGWSVGSRIRASSGSRRVELTVGALVDFQRRAQLAPRRLAVMDIAQVQALLGEAGRVQEIGVVATSGTDAATSGTDVAATSGTDVGALARRLGARLGERARVVTPEGRVAEAGALLDAFRLNLTALSFVSLLVGGFLVYASTQAALARRREELGVLRCLGATRAQVLSLVLADALLLGAVGTAAGIPLGWLAARANVRAVSATIRNLYLLEGVERVTLSPGLAALGVALGLAGALAGALAPALDLAREDPRALLGRRAASAGSARRAGRVALAAAALLAAVAAVALGPARGGRWSGFALALALLAAAALLAPLVLSAAGWLALPRRLGVAYGARDLAAHLRATAVAAGALATAVSMLAGITVMIGSFRQTVDDWLAATLRADVYVTTPSWRRGQSEAALAPEVVDRLARAPGVRAVDRLRQLFVEVAGRRVSVTGFASSLPEAGGHVQLVGGERAAALRAVREEGAALVSEPLARRARLSPGGEVDVAGPSGPVRLRVAGVYRDYGAESGAVLVDLRTLARHFGGGPPTNLALYLEPGLDAERAVERLRADFAGEALVIRSNRTLRANVLGVFEQTFAVTRLLEAMSLLVAACGVTLALLVLARERSAEVALYRALGATRAQVFRVFVGRGLGIALAGLLLGAAGGAGLAVVLVDLINPAWFGWSIALHAPWRALAGEALLLLAAALAASAYPALRASSTPATELARDAL
jgi:putative ABC transport system permease protein